MRRLVALAALAALVLASTPARAYRPFDSTDASVADLGELEIELGPVGYLRAGPAHALAVPTAILNVGFARRWEVVVQGRDLVSLDATPDGPRARLVDAGAFLKGVLRAGTLQGRAGPSVAIEAGPLFPETRGPGAFGATVIGIA